VMLFFCCAESVTTLGRCSLICCCLCEFSACAAR